jgi:hypothetical protein
MKAGDMVRFALWEDIKDVNDWSTTPKNHVGLLIEHEKYVDAKILYKGKILMIRGQLVEKAGKKDYIE